MTIELRMEQACRCCLIGLGCAAHIVAFCKPDLVSFQPGFVTFVQFVLLALYCFAGDVLLYGPFLGPFLNCFGAVEFVLTGFRTPTAVGQLLGLILSLLLGLLACLFVHGFVLM